MIRLASPASSVGFSLAVLCLLATGIAGCGDDRGRGGPLDGRVVGDTSTTRDSSTLPGDGAIVDTGPGGTVGDCSEAARWVYLVDSDDTFLRFQPDDLSMTVVGTLDCPGGSSPFSMSVDRNARAWVLHQDHNVYMVSTANAGCVRSDYVPDQSGFELFGMGFAADAASSTQETLFVSGGAEGTVASGSARLASISSSTLQLSPIGTVPGWPELTGTGSGELWGFFPDTNPPSVRQLDKATGNTLTTFDLNELSSTVPSAWAFAFWGGRFYVFYEALGEPSTSVYRVDPDGTVTQVLSNTGRRIVGAGVSTCAPVELI